MSSVLARQPEDYQCLKSVVNDVDRDGITRAAEDPPSGWTTQLLQPFEGQHLQKSNDSDEQDAVSTFALSKMSEEGASQYCFATVLVSPHLEQVYTIFLESLP